MSNYTKYAKPPDNQMGFPGLIDNEAEEIMEKVRAFAAEYHLTLWPKYLSIVRQDMADWPDGLASANDCLSQFKKKNRKELSRIGYVPPDNHASAFSRVAREWDKTLRFRDAKSRFDAYTTAVL